MKQKSWGRHLLLPLIASFLYLLYFYALVKFLLARQLLIPLGSISKDNLGLSLAGDFLGMLLPSLILLIIYRRQLASLQLVFKHTFLQYALIVNLVVLFISFLDFSLIGFYRLFFYLVVVAFGEEFLFRGYLYTRLRQYHKIFAVLASGFFWGIMHALLPRLVAGDSAGQIAWEMLNHIGGGIIMGYYFIYLLEKSGSLLIPVLVHAILDFPGGGGFSVGTAFAAWLYLFLQGRIKAGKSPLNSEQ